MSGSKIDDWANGLLDRPIGMSDDYGNSVLSLGLAAQQQPHGAQVLTAPPSDGSSLQNGFGKAPLRPRAKACVTCHERKVKCDFLSSGPPCTNCRKANRADCTPHRRRQRVVAPQLNANASSTAPGSTNDGQSPRQPYSPFAQLNGRSSQEQEQLDPRLRVDNMQLSNAMQRPARDPDAGACQCALVDFLREEVSHQHTYHGPPKIENIGTASSSMQFLANRSSTFDPLENKTRGNSHTMINGIGLTPASQDQYVLAYWEHANTNFPILDAEDYDKLKSNHPDALMLNAIMLVGAHIVASEGDRAHVKSHFYQRAKSLFDVGIQPSQATHVQAALLLSWQSDPVDGRNSSTAWYWINMARTIATDLGMHRNIERSSLDSNTKSKWRRLWWLIFHCDTWMSLHLGRPQSIHLEDCDVQELRPSDLEVLDSDADIHAVLAMTELAIVVSNNVIPCFRPTLSVAQRHLARTAADHALLRWESRQKFRDNSPPSFSHALLRLHYYSTLILIHRPDTGEKRLATRSTPSDAVICHLAARNVATIMETIRSEKQVTHLPYSLFPILLCTLIECVVESNTSDRAFTCDVYHIDQPVRETICGSGFWPDNGDMTERFSVATEKALAGRSVIAADVQEMDDLSRQQSQAGGSTVEEGEGMQVDGVDDAENESNAAVMFFGAEAVAETAPLRAVWREWRQLYWALGHNRCV